jgi:hypothetical protein
LVRSEIHQKALLTSDAPQKNSEYVQHHHEYYRGLNAQNLIGVTVFQWVARYANTPIVKPQIKQK